MAGGREGWDTWVTIPILAYHYRSNYSAHAIYKKISFTVKPEVSLTYCCFFQIIIKNKQYHCIQHWVLLYPHSKYLQIDYQASLPFYMFPVYTAYSHVSYTEFSATARRNKKKPRDQMGSGFGHAQAMRQPCLPGACTSSGQWMKRKVRSRNRQLCWISCECQSPEAVSYKDYPQESLGWNFQELLWYLAMQVLWKSTESPFLINKEHM